MIFAERFGNGVIKIIGMDVQAISPAAWRIAIQRMGKLIQRRIRDRYVKERDARRPFRRNTRKWTAWKARHGYPTQRGQYKRRILRTLWTEDMFTVSQITPAGTAFLTFDEVRMQVRQPHARYFAKQKIYEKRVLSVNWTDIKIGLRVLREAEAIADRLRALEEMRKAVRPGGISITPAGRRFSTDPGRLRRTLAQTAWRAVLETTARLKLLGRR